MEWEKARHMLPASQNTTAPARPAPRYGPVDAFEAPRYTGIKTFARCPHISDPDGVDERVHLPSITATAQAIALFITDWCGVMAAPR